MGLAFWVVIILHVDKNEKYSLEWAEIGRAEPSIGGEGGYLHHLQEVSEVSDTKLVNTKEM